MLVRTSNVGGSRMFALTVHSPAALSTASTYLSGNPGGSSMSRAILATSPEPPSLSAWRESCISSEGMSRCWQKLRDRHSGAGPDGDQEQIEGFRARALAPFVFRLVGPHSDRFAAILPVGGIYHLATGEGNRHVHRGPFLRSSPGTQAEFRVTFGVVPHTDVGFASPE